MKIIDLLNKIANGEEVPKKIKYRGYIYELKEGLYYREDGENITLKSAFHYLYLERCLNDEVEIIEEQKEETKPITKESMEALGYACGEIQKCFTNGWNKSLKNEPLIEGDKKIPEKLESYISCGWNGTCKDLKREDLFNDLKKIGNKINEIIDYLEEKE